MCPEIMFILQSEKYGFMALRVELYITVIPAFSTDHGHITISRQNTFCTCLF